MAFTASACFFRIGPVFEIHHQLARLGEFHRVIPMEAEETLGGFGGLHIAVFPLCGLYNLEMNLGRRKRDLFEFPLLFRHLANLTGLSEIEGEVGKILGTLDVILVGVGPVQFHLFAVVGHREGRGLT